MKFFAALIGGLFLLSAPAAQAAEGGGASAWVKSDYLQARLLSATESLGAQTEFDAALEVKISPDWHAYWRTPGDGGLAPVFDWARAENIKSVSVDWPLPQRFTFMELQSFGYSDDLVFPLHVSVDDPEKEARLTLDLSMMVCHEICVPQDLMLDLTVPAGGESQPTMHAALIREVEMALPARENLPGLKINNMVVGPEAVVVTAFAQHGYEQADLFVEIDDEMLAVNAPPVITVDQADPRNALLTVPVPDYIGNLAAALEGKTLTLTLTDGVQALTQSYSF